MDSSSRSRRCGAKGSRSPSRPSWPGARRCRRTSAIARSCSPTAAWRGSSAARARARSSGSRRSNACGATRPPGVDSTGRERVSHVDRRACRRPDDVRLGGRHGRVRRAVRPGALAVVVGATPVAECAGAAGAQHELRRRARRRCSASSATSSAGGRARSASTVVTLDALEAIVRDGAAGPTAAVVASQGHYDEEALESILQVRRALRRSGRVAQARRGRAAPARGTRRARRRGHAESGGARPGRADCRRSRAVDPRRNRPGSSERRARGSDDTGAGDGVAPAARRPPSIRCAA